MQAGQTDQQCRETAHREDNNHLWQKHIECESAEAAAELLKNVAILFDNKIIHHYDISCPVLYVISDTEGADKICG